MKPWLTGAAAALGFGALAGVSAMRLPASTDGAPTWIADYATAQAMARETGKPLFVAFR